MGRAVLPVQRRSYAEVTRLLLDGDVDAAWLCGFPWIRGGHRQAMQQAMLDLGQPELAEKFTGYDWQDEGDAFEEGYRKHASGGEHVTYDRLRAMGNNGFQEPASGLEGRDHHRHTAALQRWQVLDRGRQGAVHGRRVLSRAAYRGG